MVDPEIDRLSPKIDRRRVERHALVVAYGAKLGCFRVDRQNLGIETCNQCRVDEGIVLRIRIVLGRHIHESSPVAAIPCPTQIADKVLVNLDERRVHEESGDEY